jgi:hypothetical protein
LGQGWIDALAAAKHPAGLLFAPCLSKDEVEAVVGAALAASRDRLFAAVGLWRDARLFDPAGPPPFASGEVFFEAERWRLVPERPA